MSSDKLVREKLRVGFARAEAHPFEVEEMHVLGKDETTKRSDVYSKVFEKPKDAEPKP